jgi:ATP-dependent helicase HrpA
VFASFAELSARVQECLNSDRRRLTGRLHRVLRGGGGGGGSGGAARGNEPGGTAQGQAAADQLPPELAAFMDDLARSEQRVAHRKSKIPRPTYPLDLPVSLRRAEIAKAITEHQVVVICGETGSGKTTQLPKICLELGRGVRGLIGHTQPRRIAARTVAQRIATELNSRLGDLVGYKVRFGDKTSPDNAIKLMTDGILLAETQGDRNLDAYDTIIIDEAHERSLNIDFLLGYLKTLLPRRKDLKVIVTSATIDPERFSRHFNDAPIISVSGRTYPVEVLYREPMGSDEDERDSDLERAILHAVDEAASYGPGDILMFFSGEREIRETAELLHKHRVPGAPHTQILPLFAKLTAEEQQKVFEPADPNHLRRIVLATNVAETSLTVPGIRYVIDLGYARINRYSPRTKVQRLEVEAISQASADQRKGRCGRVGSGVCIRLYSEEDFKSRSVYTDPEIVRTNLASVILQMAALKLGKVEDFPFLEPPDSRLIRDGYETLIELGAVTETGELTELGRDLARLPIDPRIGRMILAASDEHCLTEVLIIASALSVQDPRERPMDKQDQADEAHSAFKDQTSDFLSWQILWNAYRNQKRHMSGSKLRRWCKEKFISFVRMREWEEMHHQLTELVTSLGHHQNERHATPEAVHRAMLAGLLSNIGTKSEIPGEYLGARGIRFNIFPGSVLFRNGPKWLMAAELTRTTRLYARTVASVSPEIIERVGAHLVKKSHYDPHWDRHAGRVMCLERASLFGLELSNRRRTHFGAIDPVQARRMFIHHALVEGDMNNDAPFLKHNVTLLSSLRELEHRARRHDIITETAARFEYFNARVPETVFTVAEFERWRRVACRGDAKFLFMTARDLTAHGAEVPTIEDFPDEITLGELHVPLVYVHKVGDEQDGVTVRLPVEALGQLDVKRIDWLLPGHLREKVETIIRNIPKDFRRLLPGAGPLTEKFLSESPRFGEGDLFELLAKFILRSTTVEVTPELLRGSPLPEYLKFRIEVLDRKGEVVYAGRDLAALRAKLTPQLRQTALQSSDSRYRREGIKVWDFGDLPEKVEMERLGVKVAAFPGLVDNISSVGLRLFESAAACDRSMRSGTRRLFMLDCADDLRRYSTQVHGLERMAAYFAPMGSSQTLRASLVELIADRAFIADLPLVRTHRGYFERRGKALDRLGGAVRECCDLVSQVLQLYHQVQLQLSGKAPTEWATTLSDVRDQLAHLFPTSSSSVFVAVPFEQFKHYPRYLHGVQTRLRKLPGEGLNRDKRHMGELAPMWRGALELLKRQDELGLDPAKVAEYRWLCEEFRVSLFAQELRTAVPVSIKRLQELWMTVVR